MKRLLLLATIATFLFASCCSNKEKCEATDGQNAPHKCCQEMSEEQKQTCTDWKNWESLDEERKIELVSGAKEKYDLKKAEREERMVKIAEFDLKMENWETLSLDEKKALCDEMYSLCKGNCNHGEGHKHNCQGKHHHEGCQGKHKHEHCKEQKN